MQCTKEYGHISQPIGLIDVLNKQPVPVRQADLANILASLDGNYLITIKNGIWRMSGDE
jgi:hypothetical protein